VADQIDPRLLDRYVTGECTPAERIVVEAWIAEDERRREMVDGLLAFRARLEARAAAQSVDAMQARLKARLMHGDGDGVLRFPRLDRSYGHRWTAVAAAVVAGVSIMAAYGAWRVDGRRNERPVWREYASASGERNTVTLADGTQFTLAPESRLRVPLDYAKGHRAVELDGEGFFQVVHDAAHPFSVRAGHVVTVDVGTNFDVRAYAGERTVRVGVSEGEVALRVGRMARPMVAGDVARVDTGGGMTTMARGVNSSEYLAWTRGTLVFRGAPLEDVMAELSRWYDVSFAPVGPALGDVKVTASYEQESLDEVLDQLGSVIGARVERTGQVITLIPIAARQSSRPGLELRPRSG
jgi:transmembrane sensor